MEGRERRSSSDASTLRLCIVVSLARAKAEAIAEAIAEAKAEAEAKAKAKRPACRGPVR